MGLQNSIPVLRRAAGVFLLAVLMAASAGLQGAPQAGRRGGKKPGAVATTEPAPAPKPKPPAERVAEVLQQFISQANLRGQGKNPPEKTVRLSESDLNAYLKQAIESKARHGITSVYVKLISPGYVGATATIDFDKVKVEDSSLPVRMVRSVLSGQKQIYVEGTITGNNGEGQFQLQKAYFGSVRLPVYFIEKVIGFLGSRQNPPIDTGKPVPLPFGLRKVNVAAGSVELRG